MSQLQEIYQKSIDCGVLKPDVAMSDFVDSLTNSAFRKEYYSRTNAAVPGAFSSDYGRFNSNIDRFMDEYQKESKRQQVAAQQAAQQAAQPEQPRYKRPKVTGDEYEIEQSLHESYPGESQEGEKKGSKFGQIAGAVLSGAGDVVNKGMDVMTFAANPMMYFEKKLAERGTKNLVGVAKGEREFGQDIRETVQTGKDVVGAIKNSDQSVGSMVGDFAVSTGKNLAGSVAAWGTDLAGDVLLVLNNITAAGSDISGVSDDYLKDQYESLARIANGQGTEHDYVNADLLLMAEKMFDTSEKIRDWSLGKVDNNKDSFTSLLAEKRFGDALQLGISTTMQSLPDNAVIALNKPLGTAAVAIKYGNRKQDELLRESPAMNKWKRILASAGTGVNTAVAENFFNVFEKIPKGTDLNKLLGQSTMRYVAKKLGKELGTATFTEGLEEVAETGFNEAWYAALDWYFDEDPTKLSMFSNNKTKEDWRNSIDQLLNDFIGGAIGGLFMGGGNIAARSKTFYDHYENAREAVSEVAKDNNVSELSVAQAVDGASKSKVPVEKGSVVEQFNQKLAQLDFMERNVDEKMSHCVNTSDDKMYLVSDKDGNNVGYIISGENLMLDADGQFDLGKSGTQRVSIDDGRGNRRGNVPLASLKVIQVADAKEEREYLKAAERARLRNEKTFQVGDKVYLTENGQVIGDANPSVVTGSNAEGLQVSTKNADGTVGEQTVPHEQAEQVLTTDKESGNVQQFVNDNEETVNVRTNNDGTMVWVDDNGNAIGDPMSAEAMQSLLEGYRPVQTQAAPEAPQGTAGGPTRSAAAQEFLDGVGEGNASTAIVNAITRNAAAIKRNEESLLNAQVKLEDAQKAYDASVANKAELEGIYNELAAEEKAPQAAETPEAQQTEQVTAQEENAAPTQENEDTEEPVAAQPAVEEATPERQAYNRLDMRSVLYADVAARSMAVAGDVKGVQDLINRVFADSGIDATVTTQDEFLEQMKKDGVSEKEMAEVRDSITPKKKGLFGKKQALTINGFYSESANKVYVNASAMSSATEAIRIGDFHERTHQAVATTKEGQAALRSLMKKYTCQDMRAMLRKLTNDDAYDHLYAEDNEDVREILADEVLAHLTQFSRGGQMGIDAAMNKAGIADNKTINSIKKLYNGLEQRNLTSNPASKRKSGIRGSFQRGTQNDENYSAGDSRSQLDRPAAGARQRSEEETRAAVSYDGTVDIHEFWPSVASAIDNRYRLRKTESPNQLNCAEIDKHSIRFNMVTEDKLEEAILEFAKGKDAKRLGWVSENIKDIVTETRDMLVFLHKAITGDPTYDEFAKKNPTMKVDWRDGMEKPIVTWARNNIEYKFDMSSGTFCINNEAIEKVFAMPVMADLMLHTADFSEYTSDDYLTLYSTLRDLGFFVSCKGCFDAAARIKMLPSVAQNFARDVNAVIVERNADPEAFDAAVQKMKGDKTESGLPAGAATKLDAIRIGVAGDKLTEPINWTQLMSAKGQTKMLSDWGGIFRAWQRTGAGRPKDKLVAEPYSGVIMKGTTTIIAPYGEKTPSFRDIEVNQGTGLRRNSHDEFRMETVIDEIQFMRDAWLQKLRVFKYSKELDDVRLFGRTGAKYNMSGFPAWIKGGTAAGLDENGKYAMAEESIGGREFPYKDERGITHYDGYKGMEEALKYCNKDVSLSTVVFSVPHLIKCMVDTPTPSNPSGIWGSFIPFHSSGATNKALFEQGLGLARANGIGHDFMKEALTDYHKGVTAFEQVQNDRFGEGWTVLLGMRAGTEVKPGHKLEFVTGTAYRNEALGVTYFASKNAYKTLGGTEKFDIKGEFYTLDSEDNKVAHPFVIDYNDKVRELSEQGDEYAYKTAADFYIEELRKIGLLPRFDFEVPEEIFIEMCSKAVYERGPKEGQPIDPHDPKLGWKGEGHGWSPCDSDAYYAMFCDYGMTDPETGKLAPHHIVLEGQTSPDALQKALPKNYVEVIRTGLERNSTRNQAEDEMVNEAVIEYCKRSIANGKMNPDVVSEILAKHGIKAKFDSNGNVVSSGKFSVTSREAWNDIRDLYSAYDSRAIKWDELVQNIEEYNNSLEQPNQGITDAINNFRDWMDNADMGDVFDEVDYAIDQMMEDIFNALYPTNPQGPNGGLKIQPNESPLQFAQRIRAAQGNPGAVRGAARNTGIRFAVSIANKKQEVFVSNAAQAVARISVLSEDNADEFGSAIMQYLKGDAHSYRYDYATNNGVEIRVKTHSPNWNNFLTEEKTDDDYKRVGDIINVTLLSDIDRNADDVMHKLENFAEEFSNVKVADVKIESGTTLKDAIRQIDDAVSKSGININTTARLSVYGKRGAANLDIADAEYMDAVNNGDMEKAAQMVRDAAAKAMPDTKVVDGRGKPKMVFHGANSRRGRVRSEKPFTSFNPTEDGIFFTDNKEVAEYFTETGAAYSSQPYKKLVEQYKNSSASELKKLIEVVFGADVKKETFKHRDGSVVSRYWVDCGGSYASEFVSKIDEAKDFFYDVAIKCAELDQDQLDGNGFDYDRWEPEYGKWEMNYNVYLNITNPLVVDAKGKSFFQITLPTGEKLAAADAAGYAKNHGYDGVIIKNILETPYDIEGTDYIALYPEQIKSVEAVSYDDNGNVIPLSERFNPAKKDIRFSAVLDYVDELNLDLDEKVQYIDADLRDADSYTRAVDIMMDAIDKGNKRAEMLTNVRGIFTNELKRAQTAVATERRINAANVKALSRIAQSLNRHGWIDTTHASQLNRLLGAMANQTGDSLEKSLIAFRSIVADASLKKADELLKETLKVKPTKLNSAGVEVQGDLDIAGQTTIKAFRDAMETEGISSEKLQEMMADLNGRIDATEDEPLKADLRAQWNGLYIAQQYMENVIDQRDNIDALVREYTAAKNETLEVNDKLHRDAKAALLKSMLENIASLKAETADAIDSVTKMLSKQIAIGAMGAESFIEEDAKRTNELHHKARREMQGLPNRPIIGKASGLRRLFDACMSPARSFESVLRYLGYKSPEGEGELFDHFIGGWIQSRNNQLQGVIEAMEEIDRKVYEIFYWDQKPGKFDGHHASQYAKDLMRMPGAKLTYLLNGKAVTTRLSQDNLAYIYMVSKMEDGRMKLAKMGITPEKVEYVTEKLDPKVKKFCDWIQQDFLVKKRNKYNEVHMRMFGAPMGAIENYFPLKIDQNARKFEDDLATDGQTAIQVAGTTTGAIKKRTKNSVPLDIRNAGALSETMAHILQMEQWAAFAEFNRDVNRLFSFNDFKNKLKSMDTIYGKGDAFYRYVREVFQLAAGTYKPIADPVSTAVNFVAKGTVSGKINFRLYTAFKQISSHPAFIPYMTEKEFNKSYWSSWVHWGSTYRWAYENLPIFRERVSTMDMGDYRLEGQQEDFSTTRTLDDFIKRWMQACNKAGMAANRAFDSLTCAMGAKGVYDATYAKYKALGLEEDVCKEKAQEAAVVAYNKSQQSNEQAFVSTIQRDKNIWAFAVAIYRNSPIAYTRNFFVALNGLKNQLGKMNYEMSNTEANKYYGELQHGGTDAYNEFVEQKANELFEERYEEALASKNEGKPQHQWRDLTDKQKEALMDDCKSEASGIAFGDQVYKLYEEPNVAGMTADEAQAARDEAWATAQQKARTLVRKRKDVQIEYLQGKYERMGVDSEKAAAQARSDYKKGIGKNVAGVIVYGYVMNMVWRLFQYLPYLALGDDKDKKKDLVINALTGGAYFSPITGLVGGSVLERIGDGSGKLEEFLSPSIAMTTDFENLGKNLTSGKFAEFCNDLISVMVQSGTGFDPNVAAKALATIYETWAESDDTVINKAQMTFMALTSIPKSQQDAAYFDQLLPIFAKHPTGNWENIRKDPDYVKLMGKYKDIKMVESAPMTFWARTKATKFEKADQLQKNFNKVAKERYQLTAKGKAEKEAADAKKEAAKQEKINKANNGK